jgi:hypothetical protein
MNKELTFCAQRIVDAGPIGGVGPGSSLGLPNQEGGCGVWQKLVNQQMDPQTGREHVR